MVPTMAALTKRDMLNLRLQQMRDDRVTHEDVWRDLGDYIAPYSHEFEATNTNQGTKRDHQIVNSTPPDSLDIFTSGLLDGLCNPASKWMSFEAEDADLNDSHAVQVYCQTVTDRFLSELAKSNFYDVAPEDFGSIGAFGNAASVQLEHFGSSCFWFGALPIGSYYVGVDQFWTVNALAREWQMTAAQMVAQFGFDACSKRVQEMTKNGNGGTKVDVVHQVYPNPDYQEGLLGPKGKAFSSCYYEVGGDSKDKYLLEEGFDLFPFRVPRWKTRGNGAWEYGPGHRVISDCRALMALEYDVAMAAELSVNPPTITPPGVNLQATAMLPGARSQAPDLPGAQGVRPLFEVNFDIQKASLLIERAEKRIETGLYKSIFMMIANARGDMTAREIIERAHEKRLVLSPILRLTREYLTPTAAFGLQVMGRRGKLPPPPPELQGRNLKIVFKGVLAQAAQLEEATAIERTVGFISSLAGVFPEITDNLDPDEIAREHSRMQSASAKIIRDPKAVEAIRAQRAQQQQQQQQMEQAMAEAETAKTMSQADTEGKNGLTDIIRAAQK